MFPSDFLAKLMFAFLISPMHPTCPTHHVPFDLISIIKSELCLLDVCRKPSEMLEK
jgi:hypothetical protein